MFSPQIAQLARLLDHREDAGKNLLRVRDDLVGRQNEAIVAVLGLAELVSVRDGRLVAAVHVVLARAR